MERSLLYVSECLLAPGQAEAEVNSIVAVSRSRNASLAVTGALIYTPAAFAQFLEGSESALDDLMESIRRDRRHRKVKVVATSAISERCFDGWSMAYRGSSSYVFQHIHPLLREAASSETSAQSQMLARLMQEFERYSASMLHSHLLIN